MITDISHLKPEHIVAYLKHLNPNLTCPVCQTKNKIFPIVDDLHEDGSTVVFTDLKPYDAFGKHYDGLSSLPTVTCVCNHCGYTLSFLAASILKSFLDGDVNER